MKGIFATIVFFAFITIAGNASCKDYFSKIFGDMDIDDNHYIEYEEYEYYMTYPEKEVFKKMDLSGDGKLQLFEWVNFQQKLDPQVHTFEYHYKDRFGNRFYHRDRTWYRVSDGFVYKFSGVGWEKLGRVRIFHCYPRHWYHDPFWRPRYYYHHDGFDFGYHHGFGYRYGFRYWD